MRYPPPTRDFLAPIDCGWRVVSAWIFHLRVLHRGAKVAFAITFFLNFTHAASYEYISGFFQIPNYAAVAAGNGIGIHTGSSGFGFYTNDGKTGESTDGSIVINGDWSTSPPSSIWKSYVKVGVPPTEQWVLAASGQGVHGKHAGMYAAYVQAYISWGSSQPGAAPGNGAYAAFLDGLQIDDPIHPGGNGGNGGGDGGTGGGGGTGPQGPAGPAGPQGPAGPAGADGASGPQGPAGADGAQGPAGPAGPAGADGAQGPAGNDGINGTNGADGKDGKNGARGATGAQGPAGPAGATGPQGVAGTNGINGTNGRDGATGAQGPAGLNGADGKDGAPGVAGPQGPQGLQGPAGKDGKDGAQGIPGKDLILTDEQKKSLEFIGGLRYQELLSQGFLNNLDAIKWLNLKSKYIGSTPPTPHDLNGVPIPGKWIRVMEDNTNEVLDWVFIADPFTTQQKSALDYVTTNQSAIQSAVDNQLTDAEKAALGFVTANQSKLETASKLTEDDLINMGKITPKIPLLLSMTMTQDQLRQYFDDRYAGPSGEPPLPVGIAGHWQRQEVVVDGGLTVQKWFFITDPVAGVAGAKGETGAQGEQGQKGDKGDTGPQGVAGPAGAAGRDGIDGKDGAAGPAGVAGRDGMNGQDGKDGQDGATGPAGVTGAQGIAGTDGKDGAQGPAGADGKDGQDGKDGINGQDGQDGKDGADGVNGMAGAKGDKGDQGDRGARGRRGRTGAQGAPGVAGAAGADGASGPTAEEIANAISNKLQEPGETPAAPDTALIDDLVHTHVALPTADGMRADGVPDDISISLAPLMGFARGASIPELNFSHSSSPYVGIVRSWELLILYIGFMYAFWKLVAS